MKFYFNKKRAKMENLKKFKISNPKQVLGGKSAIVEDEVVFLQSIVIVDDVVF